jgi:hypothetical protein
MRAMVVLICLALAAAPGSAGADFPRQAFENGGHYVVSQPAGRLYLGLTRR